MLNYELQQLLSRLDPSLEVDVFIQGGTKGHQIVNAYVGNERYLPGKKNIQANNKIFLEVSR